MPASVIAAAVVSFFGITSTIAVAAIGLAAAVVTSVIVSKLFAPSTPDANAGASGASGADPGVRSRLATSTENKLSVCYGSSWIKGAQLHGENTSDYTTAYFLLGLCEAIPANPNTLMTVAWQEFILTLGNDGWVTNAVDGQGNVVSDFNNNIRVQFFANGLPVDRSSLPNTTFFQDATKLMSRYTCAIITVKYVRDKQIFRLEDMSFNLMNTLSGPGSVLKDYLTNTLYGGALPLAMIDTATLTALDTYAATQVPFRTSSDPTILYANRYAINGPLNPNNSVWDNVQDVCRSCGTIFKVDATTGLFTVFIDQVWTGNPAYAFDDTTIVGKSNLVVQDYNSVPNVLEVGFADGSSVAKGSSAVFTYNTPSNLLPINAPVNKENVSYGLINNSVQAKRLAALQLNQWQLDLTYTFESDHRALGISSGDVISISSDINGWTNKLFRVAAVSEQEGSSGSIGLEITVKEYSAAIYTDLTILAYDPAQNVNTPSGRSLANYVPLTPVVGDITPIANVPFFNIYAIIPLGSQRVDYFEIYYSTNSTTGFQLLISVAASTPSGAFPGGNVPALITTLIAGTYYFNIKYFNGGIASNLSLTTNALVWNPQPSASTTGVAINPNWNPGVILVPANAAFVATTVGQMAALSLYSGTNLLTYSASATDAGMANNTWRVASQIVSAGLTLTGPVAGTTTATWTVTAMTVNSATLTVVLRYKDTTGNVIAIGDSVIGFTEVVQSGTGATAYIQNPFLTISQNSDGSYPITPSNMVMVITTTGTITKTQPVTADSNGFLTYGTPSGDASITVTTTGTGARFGSISFSQASSGITLTGNVRVQQLAPSNITFIVYRRSASTAPETAPALPTGGTIDTATGLLSTAPVGWSASAPAGTNVLYQSQISITYQPFSGLLNITTAWSTPTQSSQTLTSGARYVWGLVSSLYVPVVVPAIVYFRQTGTVAPTTPSGGSASITNGQATITSPAGWTSTLDNSNYDLKFSSTAILTTVSDTQVYTPTWGSPVFIFNPVGQVANQYIFRTGAQPAVVPNPSAAELLTVFVRNQPRFGDAVVVQYSSPLTYVSFTYNGTAWSQAASFIKGDQVVSGTITAGQIAALTITGDRVAASTITADKVTINSLSAITANMGTLTAGTIQVGSSPAISGTTMTGSGALLNPSGGIAGRFALGNAQTNIVYDGSSIYLNGPVIASGNLQANSITTTAITAGSVIASKVTIDGFNIIANGDAIKVGSVYQTQVLTTTGTVTYSGNLTTAIINPVFYTNLITWTSVPSAAGNVTISLTIEVTATGLSTTGTVRVRGDYTGTSGYFGIGTTVVTLTATRSVPVPTNMQIQVELTSGNNTRVNGACAVVFNQVTSPSPTTKAIAATNTYP